MTKQQIAIVWIVGVLAAGIALSCNSSSNAVMATPLPTFIADRTNAAPNEIYIIAEDIQHDSIIIGFYCNYQKNGPPLWSAIELEMEIANLEPLSAAFGSWPAVFSGGPMANIDIEPNVPDSWYLFAGTGFGSGYCVECPSYQTGLFLLATVTIRIKQSGTHRIELRPSARFVRTMAWCPDGCVNTDRGAIFPTFGGTVIVP